MRYKLEVAATGEFLRWQEFDAPPPDPVGKGWRWVEDPVPPPEPPTLDDLKAAAAGTVQARRDALIAGGVTIDFGGTVGPKVIQTATDYDRMNWITILTTAQAFAAMGQGAEAMNPIRTLDNTMVPATVDQAIAWMIEAQSRLGAAWRYAAELKDTIAAAADAAALAAIDLETGWPQP